MRPGPASWALGVRGFSASTCEPAGRDAVPVRLRRARRSHAGPHRPAGGGGLGVPLGTGRPRASAAQRAGPAPRRGGAHEASPAAVPRGWAAGSLTVLIGHSVTACPSLLDIARQAGASTAPSLHI